MKAQERPTDQWLANPVDDRTFETFLDFFRYDQDLPFDARVSVVGEAEGIQTQRITFQSTAGDLVTALLQRPVALGDQGYPAMIFLHGGGARGKGSRYNVRVTQLAAKAGLAVLSIDMQHFGERNTGLLETFSESEKHERLYNQESTYLDWVVQTVKDVGRAYDYLIQERGADSSRVALMGFSRGAQAAIVSGGADSRLAAVIVLFGGHFDLLEDGHLAAACPANYIGHIGPRPLLMVNAENDADFLKATSVLPLQRLARDPKYFHWTSGGHGFFAEEDEAFLVAWLQEHLR
jgi:dienelactone hydrolase